jgi:methylmalonyl-CoA carboxyltransferase large subunit
MRASELRSALDEIRALLGDLGERVARLEASPPAAAQAAAMPPPAPAPAAAPVLAAPAGVPETTILAISAAVAAFLGERAHVRQIRLISTGAWAQQGRVSVQASHRLQR